MEGEGVQGRRVEAAPSIVQMVGDSMEEMVTVEGVSSSVAVEDVGGSGGRVAVVVVVVRGGRVGGERVQRRVSGGAKLGQRG